MIVFITNFDATTSGNLAVILPIFASNCTILSGNDAIKDNLVNTLISTPNAPIFIASHGKPTYFEDNNGNPALVNHDIDLLANRKIFAFACWTANELGKTEWENTTYYGYTGQVAAPSIDEASLLPFQRTIFSFIVNNYPLCNTVVDIQRFVDDLKIQVDRVIDAIDDLPIDAFDTYRFLNDVWKKLRVYHHNSSATIRHTEGFITDVFYDN